MKGIVINTGKILAFISPNFTDESLTHKGITHKEKV